MTSAQIKAKRFIDLSLAILLGIALLPFYFLIGLAIKVSSPAGSVLFTQLRIGKDRKPFYLYKFRTMIPGDHTLSTPQNPDGSLIINDDERITSIGRLLRRFSLDELPQLINVLKGEMSLIGPRPELPFQVEGYDAETAKRLKVKPGITGWAQVHGRNQLDFLKRHQLDIEYVTNYSLWLDLKILFMTLLVIFTGKGLYHQREEVSD